MDQAVTMRTLGRCDINCLLVDETLAAIRNRSRRLVPHRGDHAAAIIAREARLLFDHRTYTVKPGTLARQLELYDQHGRAAQEPPSGQAGVLRRDRDRRAQHRRAIWAYDDAGDRERRRAAMQADPEWQAFLKMSAEGGQSPAPGDRLMTPAPFFRPSR